MKYKLFNMCILGARLNHFVRILIETVVLYRIIFQSCYVGGRIDIAETIIFLVQLDVEQGFNILIRFKIWLKEIK